MSHTVPPRDRPGRARIALGAHGEELAARFLAARGFEIVDRNWRCRAGELDLVARDAGTLVGVEVKTRSGSGYGHPLAAITARKALRLRRLLYEWVRAHEEHPERLRLDAVGITLGPGAPRIEHLAGIS
ncbi:YraN family protein [Leucobacter allii]|uniref:UPF0102 protein MUN78_08630 n=1 Tax=Leucobacter allii TaxID=2932247 RepID=A0ABY4FKG3_9MICO|nr:YraN family protein [Leucobacter allii]UOQ55781.1 YraN family protein [Leucobacter allii]UOR00294.1 YraN family protein [Leucobacter allii]